MLMNHTNLTEDDLFSCYSPSVIGYRYFAVLCGCAVTVIGTVGNLMTILAFTINSQLRTRFNVLIVNLALADLLYCTILQWRSGQLWCKIFGLLLLLSNSVSIITLCLIAGSRYVMVAKRAVFDRVFSDLGLSLLIISAWTLGLASFGPLWHGYVFVPKLCVCTMTRTTYHPYSIILLLFYFFVGLGCVGTFYFLIYRHIRISSQALLRFSRRSSRKKPASSAQNTNDSGVESSVANTCSCEISSQAELAKNTVEINSEKSSQCTHSSATAESTTKTPLEIVITSSSRTPARINAASSSHCTASGDDKEMKHVTRMCLAVFLGFVFCFVPFLLINIADEHNRAPQVLYMIFRNLSWLNSCINPVLYAVMNRQFRQAYHVLHCQLFLCLSGSV
uniref:G-protein coupled receptors family 1 profile domain-containing protein n=1 Tax=Sparus aurata TaxID=8175 RepID=A0A671TJI0_SPAAU